MSLPRPCLEISHHRRQKVLSLVRGWRFQATPLPLLAAKSARRSTGPEAVTGTVPLPPRPLTAALWPGFRSNASIGEFRIVTVCSADTANEGSSLTVRCTSDKGSALTRRHGPDTRRPSGPEPAGSDRHHGCQRGDQASATPGLPKFRIFSLGLRGCAILEPCVPCRQPTGSSR